MDDKMGIPEIRDLMFENASAQTALSKAYQANMAALIRKQITLAKATKRRPAMTRTTQKSKPLTKAMEQEIYRIRALQPDLPFRDIGSAVGVDASTISRVLNGHAKAKA